MSEGALDWGSLADSDYVLGHYRADQMSEAAASGLGLTDDEDEVYDSDFAGFIRRRNPSLLKFEHVPRMVRVADRVVAGELKRVMILLPPRYFKTETWSRLLAAHFLRVHTSRLVGLASYGAELSWAISEEARTNFQGDGGLISSVASAKKRWKTMDGGEMWATGTGGPMLGFGYHLGLLDDPVDPLRFSSPSFQKQWATWWPGKFLSRGEPGAAIVVVMQRLGIHDPIDYLFRREVGEDVEAAPEHWHVVVCDEIKSNEPLGRWDGPMGLPPTCTIEPDHRKVGQVLAPSRYSKEQVDAKHIAAGPIVRSAQLQQRPIQPAGDFWRKEWFRVYTELPAHAYNGGKDWDLAYTKKDLNAASCFIESYRGPRKSGAPSNVFDIYIEDLDWRWLEFPELVSWMTEVGGPHHVEEKASGKSAVQTLSASGVAAREVTVQGDKLKRASAVQPTVSNRRVWVNKRVRDQLLTGDKQGLLRVSAEMLAGQMEGHLDLNDAFVQAIHRHGKIGARGRGRVV